LETKKFTKWGKDTNDIYTTILIERDFPNLETMSLERRTKLIKYMELLEKIIKNCYKEENYDLYELRMKILSRISGGNIIDKLWVLIIGYRNSWKSTEIDLIKNAFGSYAVEMGVGFFTLQGANGDSAKRNYQIEEAIDSRFVLLSESVGQDNDANINKSKSFKMDSSLFKNISGGDTIFLRANYGKKLISFKPTFSLLHYCNNIPQYSNKDVLNNVMYIKTDYGFLDPKDPDYNKYTYKPPIMYGENDDIDLKNLLFDEENRVDFADAYLLLMIKYFEPKKIEKPDKMYNDIKQIKEVSNQVCYNNVILEYIIPTDDETDRIHKNFVENEMIEFITDDYADGFEPKLTKPIFRTILQKLKMEAGKGKLDGFDNSKRHFYKYMKIENPNLKKLYEDWVISETANS
jgi:hypothetical protein